MCPSVSKIYLARHANCKKNHEGLSAHCQCALVLLVVYNLLMLAELIYVSIDLYDVDSFLCLVILFLKKCYFLCLTLH